MLTVESYTQSTDHFIKNNKIDKSIILYKIILNHKKHVLQLASINYGVGKKIIDYWCTYTYRKKRSLIINNVK